jgi:hypothetical protein
VQYIDKDSTSCGLTVIWTRHVVRPDGSNVLRPDGGNVGRLGAKPRRSLTESSIRTHRPPRCTELMDVHPGDVVVDKPRFGSFYGTDLDVILRSRGIDTIIIGGVITVDHAWLGSRWRRSRDGSGETPAGGCSHRHGVRLSGWSTAPLSATVTWQPDAQ